MAFSVLATIGVGIALVLIAAAGMTPVLAVPLALLAGLGLVALWATMSRMRGREVHHGPGPSGVPSTGEASYDPGGRH